MYTRPYNNSGITIDIPDNYDGSMLGQDIAEPVHSDAPHHTDEACNTRPVLPFSGLLGGLFKNGKFSLQSLEFEDLLIIGIALYMLLSKDGDMECGILLLLLLFIG